MVVFLVAVGCQKDEEQIKSPSMSITIEEIKLHIGREESSEIMTRTTNRTPLNVLPDFSTLKESINQLGNSVFIGHLNKYSLDSILKPEDNEGGLIAFFKDDKGNIRSELMIYKHKPDVFLNKNFFIINERSNFTGVNILINDKDQIEKIGAYYYGKLSHFKNLGLQIRGKTVFDPTRANVRCNCDDGCYLSAICNIYCGVMAFVNEGGSTIFNSFNWMGGLFSDIYYFWADGEWKKGSWKNESSGDPNNGFIIYSNGSWGGSWGDSNNGNNGGVQTFGNELWRSELLKCRSQQFNWIDNNGEIEQLDFMELCELKDLVGFSDCAYQYLFENRNDVFKLNYFLNSKKINGEVDAKALAAVKDLINNFCISRYTEVDAKLLEVTYCINKSNASIADKKALLDFYNSAELIDPCSGSVIDKDAIFMHLCGKDNVNMAGLDEELEGVDYIINNIDPILCPQVYRILSKLLNYSFGPDDSPGFPFLDCDAKGFTFTIGPLNADGVANWTKKTITINENLCNSSADPINIAETILHVSMHLALWAVQSQITNGDPNIDPNLLNAVNDLNNNFGGDHHEYLAAYLEGIANTLWNLNGQIGSKEDYYGLIWNGLSSGAGVDPKTKQAYSLYISQVMNTPGYNPNNYGYKDWTDSHLNRCRAIKPNNNLKFDCK